MQISGTRFSEIVVPFEESQWACRPSFLSITKAENAISFFKNPQTARFYSASEYLCAEGEHEKRLFLLA
jgi:hypothetical protein